MKKALSVLLSLILVFTIAAVAAPAANAVQGNTYYLDSENGNNSNSGLTPDDAWKDLAGFENCPKPLEGGDTVLFKASRALKTELLVSEVKKLIICR